MEKNASERIRNVYFVLFAYVIIIGLSVGAMPFSWTLSHIIVIYTVFCFCIAFAMTYQLKDVISKSPWKGLLPIMLVCICQAGAISAISDSFDTRFRHREAEELRMDYRYRVYRLGDWMLNHNLISCTNLLNLSCAAIHDLDMCEFYVYNIGKCVKQLHASGWYNADSDEAAKLRGSLLSLASVQKGDISSEALCTLVEMADFDSHIDAKYVDSLLVDRLADDATSEDARRGLVILCGQRYVESARATLLRLARDYTLSDSLRNASRYALHCLEEAKRWNVERFVSDVIEFWRKNSELPDDIPTLRSFVNGVIKGDEQRCWHYIESFLEIQKVTLEEVLKGADYVKSRPGRCLDVDIINTRLRQAFLNIDVLCEEAE